MQKTAAGVAVTVLPVMIYICLPFVQLLQGLHPVEMMGLANR